MLTNNIAPIAFCTVIKYLNLYWIIYYNIFLYFISNCFSFKNKIKMYFVIYLFAVNDNVINKYL